MPVFTHCNLTTLSYSNTRKRQICNIIERQGLNSKISGLENMNIRVPPTDSYLKRKVRLYVLIAYLVVYFRLLKSISQEQITILTQTFITQ